ncbi:probable G-protein coupled receptor 148 [Misgurnus anguillicaudatus]|uniref:probable G-protein coupled receptor 148 n=1 Tax=Misgurnus anguillicaudatus TaxID=75329 RepID=UPI002434B3E1|nr:probable G-protein coupled receptor 148 [Misgurnus anguillicaudatus]
MSYSHIVNISEEWYDIMKSRHMDLFLIPTVLLTSVTMLVNPVLFFCIVCFHSLRQETRYLLLCNTLLADMLFLIINLAVVSCNTVGMDIPYALCNFMLLSSVTTYTCSVMTFTLMVIDTYVAVRWPLRYNEFLSVSRVRKIIVSLWVLSSLCPVSLLAFFKMIIPSEQPRKVCLVLIALHSMKVKVSIHLYFIIGISVCSALIIYCYIRLYMITKTSGIWCDRYSRARMTLLAHALLLMLYFTPALVFAVELSLLGREQKPSEMAVWINLVNMCVLMLLPRLCTPYLYILRYREIYKTLQNVLWKNRHRSQIRTA